MTKTRTRAGKVKAVALVAAVGLLPLGCSDSSKQPDSGPPQDVTTTSRSRPASRCPRLTADPADADRLADAVAGMLACHDTRSDASPLDATRRAARWLDPAIVPEPGAQIRTDATWTDWRATGPGRRHESRESTYRPRPTTPPRESTWPDRRRAHRPAPRAHPSHQPRPRSGS